MQVLFVLLVAAVGGAVSSDTSDTPPVLPAQSEFGVGEGDWSSFGWKVGTTHANVLRLGNKFQLSGIGDSAKDDEWLRLYDVGNRGFFGGFAAGKLWGKSVFTTSLQIGNSWRLEADEKEQSWLRLSPAATEGGGGFATSKLKTTSLAVDGETSTKVLRIDSSFMMKAQGNWLEIVDPETKEAHKNGGLLVGSIQASNVTVQGTLSTNVLHIGSEWKLQSADDSLQLMGKNSKSLAGLSTSKLRTQHLHVEHNATFLGKTQFETAAFQGKVTFAQKAQFETLAGTTAQVGQVLLSTAGTTPPHSSGEWLHVYLADGKTYTGIVAEETKSTTATTDVLHLGSKWRLSGVGDKFHSDDWLRLMSADNSGYYGGLALRKLWTPKSYNHVIQLGTKWRLSGVGDSVKDDDWLRLMDIHNTKLFGGIATAKMRTNSLDVQGMATVEDLSIGNRLRLVGGVDGTLRLTDSKQEKLHGLQAGGITASKLKVSGDAIVQELMATKTATAGVVVAQSSMKIASWKFTARARDSSDGPEQDWLQLTDAANDVKMGKLQLGSVKSIDLVSTGQATLSSVRTQSLDSGSATLKELTVSGKIHVKDGIWVGDQRITPLPEGFMADVTALKEEVRALKAELAQLRR